MLWNLFFQNQLRDIIARHCTMRFPAKKSLLSPTPRVHADYFPESPYGRTYTDVITKISRIASLPNYLSYGAPLARASRAQGVPLKTEEKTAPINSTVPLYCCLQYYFLLISDYKIYKAILFQFLDRFFLIFHEKISPSHTRRNKFPGFPGWIDCKATHKAKEAVSTLKRHLCPRLITATKFTKWTFFTVATLQKMQNLQS